jgi:hypothetical protein
MEYLVSSPRPVKIPQVTHQISEALYKTCPLGPLLEPTALTNAHRLADHQSNSHASVVAAWL